jgi:tripartite-type tricarboxylate transporter receptor subunit TctC
MKKLLSTFGFYRRMLRRQASAVIDCGIGRSRNAMKLPRRKFLCLAVVAGALSSMARFASAQAYPTRPVRIIVGFAPGGPADILARLIGQWLSERLGNTFVIENRQGAGSNIAADAVIHASADGYTLLLITNPQAINASLYDKLNFNVIRDIAPVAGLDREPFVMLVHPSFPAKTVQEFIAYAKANTDKVNMASAGNGTGSHVSGELFKMMAGVNLLHVPYRGAAPALTDLIGGRVQVSFLPTTGTVEYIKSGMLRALAVTSATRSPSLPDVPTVGDFLPGYESSAWFGIGAPRNTPADIVEKLNTEINAGLADPTIKPRLANFGGTVLAGSPSEFGKLISEETKKWAKVVKFAGMKPD